MKATLEVYLERPLDDESKEMYKTLSEEDIQVFFSKWKDEVLYILQTEIGTDIENVVIKVGLE